MPAPYCRTCGFTDCPGATTPGGCTRWPGTEPAPAAAARPGLVPDGIDLDTPSARRLGAWILGRALAHAADLGLIDSALPKTTAATAGFSRDERAITAAAYRALLGI